MTMTRLDIPSRDAAFRPAIATLLLAVGFVLLLATAGSSAVAAEDLNRVVLRVNDEIATLHEFERRKSAELTRILGNSGLSSNDRQAALDSVGKEVMQGMFSELLLLSFADQQGVRIRDTEVDEALEVMKQQQGIASRAELEEALAAYGMSYDDLWENTRRDLLWNQVVGREVNSRIQIGDEELRAYYRNNRQQFQLPERRQLQEILVLESSGLDEAMLQQKAEEVRARLVAGEDLATVAQEGKDAGFTSGVIDLDWLEKGELAEDLENAAWGLAEGEYSIPVKGLGGLHILHLVDLEESTVRPFKEVEELIMRRERSQRFAKELRTFIKEIEQKAYIVENLPPEAVGYRNLVEDFQGDDDLEIFRAPVIEEPVDAAPSETATETPEASGSP